MNQTDWKSRHGWGLWFLIIGIIHLSYLFSLIVPIYNHLSNDTWQVSFIKPAPGTDFFVLYEAGWDFLHGRNMYLHSEEVFYPSSIPFEQRYKQSLADGVNRAPYYATFRYIPFYGYTLGVVLNIFPPITAYVFWIAVIEILLVINCLFTIRRCSTQSSKLIAFAVWFLPFPLFVELFLGQFNILMASLIFWTALAWDNRRWFKGDCFWILSVLLKTYTAGFAFLIARWQRWRIICVCLFVVVITTLPYFLIFPEGWDEFLKSGVKGRVAAGADSWQLGHLNSFGFQSALSAIFSILTLQERVVWGDVSVGGVFTFVLTFGIIALIIYRTFAEKAHWIRPFLLWVLIWFILYRDCWEHHYLLLLPVLSLLLIHKVVSQGKVVLIFLLTQTPTFYSLINALQNNLSMQNPDLLNLIRFLHFVIKPFGVALILYFLLFPQKKTLPYPD